MTLNVEDIRTLPKISPKLLNTWADGCSILLEEGKHEAPTPFKITGEWEKNTTLEWIPINDKNGYEDKQHKAEMAGYGIAALIIAAFVPSLRLIGRVAKDGGGVDLKYAKPDDSENYLNDVFVEVKCVSKKSSIKSSFDGGITQSKKKSERFPVYVIAVEFETPSALTYLHT